MVSIHLETRISRILMRYDNNCPQKMMKVAIITEKSVVTDYVSYMRHIRTGVQMDAYYTE